MEYSDVCVSSSVRGKHEVAHKAQHHRDHKTSIFENEFIGIIYVENRFILFSGGIGRQLVELEARYVSYVFLA